MSRYSQEGFTRNPSTYVPDSSLFTGSGGVDNMTVGSGFGSRMPQESSNRYRHDGRPSLIGMPDYQADPLRYLSPQERQDLVDELKNKSSSTGTIDYSQMPWAKKAETYSGSPMSAAGETLDPSQSTLSPNFAPYVYDMLSRGQGLASLPYQEYTGQRFAGPSDLQSRAFQGLAGLGGAPSQFDTATQFATQAGQAAGGLGYTPSGLPSFGQVSSGYQAPAAFQPGQFGNQFAAPGAYQAGTFTNQFSAPGAYQAGQFDTGLGKVGSVQDYMSPYMSSVTDIAGREARRQADIGRQAEQARLAQAGAYGGSRQAIMEAERQRNLGTQLEDITTKGLQSAYDRALQQRFQEAGLGLEAQRAGEASRQFGAQQGMLGAQLGAQYGLEAQRAGEQSRQFGATQGLTAADLAARYGLSAQQAAEQSRQFGATQGLTAAEQAARFGLTAQQANQQAALDAARQAEQSRQFGANLGLQGLQQQLGAAQTLGSLGTAQQQAGIAGLQAQLGAGETQRQIAQSPLDFAYQQFQESMKYPYQQTTYMQSLLQGLPLAARPYDSGQSGLMSALQGGLAGLGLYNLGTKKD